MNATGRFRGMLGAIVGAVACVVLVLAAVVLTAPLHLDLTLRGEADVQPPPASTTYRVDCGNALHAGPEVINERGRLLPDPCRDTIVRRRLQGGGALVAGLLLAAAAVVLLRRGTGRAVD